MTDLRLVALTAAWVVLGACSDGGEVSTPKDAGSRDATTDASSSTQDAGSSTQDASSGADANGQRDASTAVDAGQSGVVDDCNPVSQNCGPTQKCVVEPRSGHPGAECITIPATVDEAGFKEACSARGACEPGLACVQTSTTGATCQKVCQGTADCSGLAGGVVPYDCLGVILGTNWGSCVALGVECNPYTQEPCAADEACQPFVDSGGTAKLRCTQPGTGAQGAICGSGTPGCARGLACVLPSTSANPVCVRYCQVNDNCPGTQQCKGTVPQPNFSFCVD